MSRPICRYWQQGNCRFGGKYKLSVTLLIRDNATPQNIPTDLQPPPDSCKFEHPGQSSNRFGVFGGTGGSSSNNTAMASSSSSDPYGLSKAQILKDLGEERPQWILSSYGPGKEPPEQLFGGYPIEQSPEELRLHHLKGVMAGNPQGAVSSALSSART